MANCLILDINLPDLVVSAVTAPATANTETYATIGYTILNQGLANLRAGLVQDEAYKPLDFQARLRTFRPLVAVPLAGN